MTRENLKNYLKNCLVMIAVQCVAHVPVYAFELKPHIAQALGFVAASVCYVILWYKPPRRYDIRIKHVVSKNGEECIPSHMHSDN